MSAAAESRVEKSAVILDVVEALRLRLGAGAFDVLDYWPGDTGTIGIAPPGSDEPCVCVLTAGKAAGRYDIEHGGKMFRDCVMEGVEWAVRHELRQRKQAEIDAASDRGGSRRSRHSSSPRRRGK
jgi:hypothetical protein